MMGTRHSLSTLLSLTISESFGLEACLSIVDAALRMSGRSIAKLGPEPRVQCGIPQAQGTGITVYLARRTQISFSSRRSSEIRILSSVHWTPSVQHDDFHSHQLVSLPSFDLVSHSAFVQTSVPHQQVISVLQARCRRCARHPPTLKEHSNIFPITISAALIPFSISSCHNLAACLVPHKQHRSLPQHLVQVPKS